MLPKLIKTGDGSHSLYLEDLDENYHSVHGAIQESSHVFIEAGLNYFSKAQNINILEIGFGTGLNTFLTLLANSNCSRDVNYHSIEKNPLDVEIIQKLNYSSLLCSDGKNELFENLHSARWDEVVSFENKFFLKKITGEVQSHQFNSKFDLVYFDAFGPRVQPEMWTTEIFEKIYKAMNTNGILVTYCAKGEVKRTLKNVGFTIESLKGPHGKREMTRAIKN